jgi:hypothetical protein
MDMVRVNSSRIGTSEEVFEASNEARRGGERRRKGVMGKGEKEVMDSTTSSSAAMGCREVFFGGERTKRISGFWKQN